MGTVLFVPSYGCKPCFVIFLCTFDPFGQGDDLYSFEMRTNEEAEYLPEKRISSVFLNINGFHSIIILWNFKRIVHVKTIRGMKVITHVRLKDLL